MKITNSVLLLQATASAEFIRLTLPKVSAADDAPAKSVGLFYGTVRTKRTPVVATVIAGVAGLKATDIADTDIADTDGNFNFHEFDSIIVGAPTYNTGGDDHRSTTAWDDWLYEVLPNIDISGKNVAIFGLGKGVRYPDNFCDGAGEFYDRFSEAGANMFGFSSTDGYDYNKTKAVRNGQFIGKMFDQWYQPDETWGRANEWVEQLRDEGFF